MKLALAGAAFVVALTALTSVAACSLSEDAYSAVSMGQSETDLGEGFAMGTAGVHDGATRITRVNVSRRALR